MAKQAEVDQLEKIAMYWKYNFVLLAHGKLTTNDVETILHNGMLSVDVITLEKVAELEKKVGGISSEDTKKAMDWLKEEVLETI